MPFFKRPTGSPFDAPDDWSVLTGVNQGRPMLVRINLGLRDVAGHADFRFQMGVAVPLILPRGDGLPTPEEDQQLGDIEWRLHEELEVSMRAILVAVITTSDMREFVLYTTDRDWIAEWAPQFDAAVPGHTVQVMAQPDPKWKVYRQLTSA